jgi:hypothetical protein
MTLREVGWHLGAPARTAMLGIIRFYRAVLAGWLGGQCRFAPSCSHYAELAIREHGVTKGTVLAAWRIARCNPYGRGGLDPVPEARHPRIAYDAVPQPGKAART